MSPSQIGFLLGLIVMGFSVSIFLGPIAKEQYRRRNPKTFGKERVFFAKCPAVSRNFVGELTIIIIEPFQCFGNVNVLMSFGNDSREIATSDGPSEALITPALLYASNLFSAQITGPRSIEPTSIRPLTKRYPYERFDKIPNREEFHLVDEVSFADGGFVAKYQLSKNDELEVMIKCRPEGIDSALKIFSDACINNKISIIQGDGSRRMRLFGPAVPDIIRILEDAAKKTVVSEITFDNKPDEGVAETTS